MNRPHGASIWQFGSAFSNSHRGVGEIEVDQARMVRQGRQTVVAHGARAQSEYFQSLLTEGIPFPHQVIARTISRSG